MDSGKKLQYRWALWESYSKATKQEAQNQSHEAWMENLYEVYNFETLEEFQMVWDNLPHRQPSNFFFDQVNKLFKK